MLYDFVNKICCVIVKPAQLYTVLPRKANGENKDMQFGWDQNNNYFGFHLYVISYFKIHKGCQLGFMFKGPALDTKVLGSVLFLSPRKKAMIIHFQHLAKQTAGTSPGNCQKLILT